MRTIHALLAALVLGLSGVAGIAGGQAVRTPRGFVTLRSHPAMIDTLGIGPGTCFGPACPAGVVLRRTGWGALVRNGETGLEEFSGFRFDPVAFETLATRAADIRHRGLPCTLQVTDGGGASIFWTTGRQRVEIALTNGCPNKDDAPVLAFYDAVVGVPEVKAALAAYHRAP
ncbi:hypothetical protein ASE86_14975 [Sphingomonas sp. Leaf33]|uniref:hypothetical protein n=1 Tax=Sphingomonas sp. Leaf33 TaxID=1736215 RepID=UPI0006F4EE44|nr:hypothetical protein [Sphingomonas sp. Leaf33]KQN21264.1 hypothetical protein ASE86_14975 [Sphingomonas sp. Leaf33]